MRNSLRGLCLAACVLLAATRALVAQSIVYVDADAPGSNNGSTWTNAFVALQSALAAAPPGSQIRVAEGTYKPTALAIGGDPRSATFQLRSGVTVAGGYAGYGTPVPDARDVAAHPTILSGDLGAPGLTSDNAYHVVIGSGTGATAVLDGFTITQGEANGDFALNKGLGGGLLVVTGSPVIRNCTFTGNFAALGGGISSGTTGLTVSACNFSGNANSFYGGGAFAGSGRILDSGFSGNHSDSIGGAIKADDLHVIGCTFSGNTAGALFLGGGPGGAIECDGPLLDVSDCSFTDNQGEGRGGAISCYGNGPGDRLIVVRSDFIGNSLDGFGSQSLLGGAVSVKAASAQFTECRFFQNVAPIAGGGETGKGGALYLEDAPAVLTNCIFAGNQAPSNLGPALYGYGGGVYSIRSDPTVTNCLFSGNVAATGAGYCSTDETAGFFHCTVANNRSDFLLFTFTAAEVGINAGNGGVPPIPFTLSDCILWGNIDALGQTTEVVQFSAFPSLVVPDHCCIESLSGTLGGVGNIGGDPRFLDADGLDNIAGTLDDNLRLQVDSPCIDAGTGAAQPADSADLDCDGDSTEVTPLDLDLTARNADTVSIPDTGVGPAPVTDMGAYERSAWTNLGNALAGANGAPCLVGTGTLVGSSSVTITVSTIHPDVLSYLIIGSSALNAAFKGGVMVPDPSPPGLVVPIAIGPSGDLAVSGAWPSGLPAGFAIYFQWWALDSGAPHGLAASNALRGITP